MDTVDGELNRRLAVLGLLYNRRRTNPYSPEVSLAEIEMRLGCPRDYLQFTTWYLSRKKYITQTDSADFTLTALGVDFVESNRSNVPVLHRLLTSGAGPASTDGEAGSRALEAARTPLIVPVADGPPEGSGPKGIG